MTERGVSFELVSEDAPLIVLPVEVHGQGPFTFIFDTGATHVVLGKPLAERLGLQPTRMETGKGAFEPIEAGHVVIDSVRVGQVAADQVEAVIMDLAGMRQAIPRDFDGILGYTFFKHYRVTIDYPALTMTFSTTDQEGSR